MDTRLLEYLIVLEEEGNFARAAEKIHISQSALSQNLSKIEQELQTKLFIKNEKRWIPTEAGVHYLNGAKEMVAIREQTYRKIKELANSSRRQLRIGICPEVFQLYNEQILEILKRNFPEYQPELYRADTDIAMKYLTNDTLDIAILHLKDKKPNTIHALPLYEERLILGISNEFAWEGVDIDYAQLVKCPFIFPDKFSFLGVLIQNTLKEKQLYFPESHCAEMMNGAIHLISHGYGATLIPSRMKKMVKNCTYYPWSHAQEYTIYFATTHSHTDRAVFQKIYELIHAVI